MRFQRSGFLRFLPFTLLLFALPVLAQNSCDLPSLSGQHQDATTVQHLEEEWTRAYLRGDAHFMECLLIPNFAEIMANGQVKFLADELQMARKNTGKNLPIPELPKPEVLLHGNVAVAYGVSTSPGADGKTRSRRYSDSYLWENGAWHVFFAQQTRVENN